MKVTQTYLQSLIGQPVIITDAITEWETCLEVNMRGTIVKYRFDSRGEHPLHAVWVDQRSFLKYNKPLQNANYFDDKGKPTLTAEEAGFWEDVVMLHLDDDTEKFPFKRDESRNPAEQILYRGSTEYGL